MANPEHVAILTQGVEAWNTWRQANKQVKPDLRQARIHALNLSFVNLRDAILSGTTFSQTVLDEADLLNAELSSADFSESTLTRSRFARSNLSSALLTGTDLSGADFTSANMRNAVFWGANLSNSKFSYANLDGTDFRHSKISWTVFAGVNLAVCFGLEDVLHGGPSSIGMDTLYLSRGFIAETFLGRCALDAAAISFAKSLTRGVLHWRFMSYSSKDQDFAVRLHANLQARGVVCWLATEELKLGDISRQRRDEAIRASDKLLVVLSESSIISRWLQDEVESAIERESREHRLILFPIRIDSAVMDSDQTWAARIRRTRYIGDFSKWQDRSSYETAFDRLLRDLKTEDDIAMTSE